MKVIGFNLSKVHAEKNKEFNAKNINLNIEFTDIEKDKIDLLKDAEALKVSFKYSVEYADLEKEKKEKPEKQAEISFEGLIVLAADKKESKEIQSSWKKKAIPNSVKVPLNNLILKRCAAKSLQLQEDLNLPSHLPLPQIQLQQPNQ